MASSGIDDCETHIFDGTNFALWKNHMLDHFPAKGPKFWWIVTNGLTHNLDHKNLTKAQKVLFELDCEAYCYLMKSLSFELFDRINSKGTAYEMWESIKHTFGDSSTWDDGKFKKEEPKVDIHEDVEHCHNKVVVEDCSTSWSSEDEDDGYESDASTSSSTSSHSSMSYGNGKISIGGVIVDCDDPKFELVCRLTKALRNEMAKTSKLKNENSFLKTTCEQQKHLLYVTTCSHEELKLTHEELCVTHDNLVKDHAFLTKKISNEEIKTSESSSLGSNDQSHIVTNPCDVGKKHVSTSCDDLLSMPCSSQLDICSTSMSCETNLLKENNELKNEVKNLSNKLERCYYSKVTFEHVLKTQRNYGDKCGLGFKKKMTKGKRKQEKRKLSHFMCYRCHEVGHLANDFPNKEKLKKMKEEERLKHVKCFKCRTWGHLTSMCPTKQLVKHQAKPQQKPQVEQEKKPQAQVKIYHEDGGDMGMMKKKTRRGGRQSRSSKDLSLIKCFECKNDGHFASRWDMLAHSCPLGNNSKLISIDDITMLRKDGNGTSMVGIAKHPAIHTKASPKYVAPNLRGPKLVWVPSKIG
ncbi:hypothetical protein BDA96_02G224800 [Sorghum bicolor]|uniref:CCHC-type domain-containing protein n=1 Tax=Sorghum bicolor TaxID=4558 RepID=A0A921RR46_SORBI|nr:hypothetical protein BDA96_02G224800 [Sorghum bicolor]